MNNHLATQNIIFVALISLLSSTLIIGCGSGGNSGSDDNSGSNDSNNDLSANNPPIVEQTPTSSEPSHSIKTEDLIAQEDFNFATKHAVKITVNLSAQQAHNERYQVNFYTHYETREHTYLPHFKTQVASGIVINGQFNQTVQLNNTTTQVLAELWTYDGAAPTQEIITIEDALITWQL